MPLLIISPKDVYATKRLQEEADLAHIDLQIFDVADLKQMDFKIDPKDFSLLYIRQAYPYFQEIINLAKKFDTAGVPVVDRTIAEGDLGLGKLVTLQKLQESNLVIPTTNLASILKQTDFKFPLVAKWNYGFGGKQVHLIKKQEDLTILYKEYPPTQLLVQEFIPAEYEYKVVTIDFKSLPMVLKFKTKPDGFTPDFEHYEVIESNRLPQVVSLAERASKILNRELAKTDILETNGKLYILEVNRWPGLQTFEKFSNFNAVKAIIDYLNQQKQHL